MSAKNQNLLTVLVEDYFHVGAFENLIQQRNWQNFEPRYEQNTLKTLDLLDRYDTKATFFVLGWIAESSPDLIRALVERGHEVASRGFYHRSARNLTPTEFREDLRRANAAIEKACGQTVAGYRAAEKLLSIRARGSWMSWRKKEWHMTPHFCPRPLPKNQNASRTRSNAARSASGNFRIRR